MQLISQKLTQLISEQLKCNFESFESILLEAKDSIKISLMETGAIDFEQGNKQGMLESMLVHLGGKIKLNKTTQRNLNDIYFDSVSTQVNVWGLGKIAQACGLSLSRYETCFYLKAFYFRSLFDGDINDFLEIVKKVMPPFIFHSYMDGVAWNHEKIPTKLLSSDSSNRKEIIEYLKQDKGCIQTEIDLHGREIYSVFSFIEHMDHLFIDDPNFISEALNINPLFFYAIPKRIREMENICVEAIIRNREIRNHLELSDDYQDKCLLRVYEEYLPDYCISRETIIAIKDNGELIKSGITLETPKIEPPIDTGDFPF